MLSIASVVFIVIGIIFIIAAIVILDSGGIYMIVFGVIALGLSQICLGISMRKLSKLEDRLAKYIFLPGEDQYPEIICERCGREYDKDFSECPYCELERIKHR